ncbi:GntR family transcriptional regulator [Clostridium paraputrificum]|uniref:GntR family transcriptional regulator n=1 Tax=Clostridium TaxID=1485 RepID=UPI003D33A42A
MLLRIDLDSEEPIYQQIKNEVIKGIAKGEIVEGDELPSVRSLAEEIGVNMHTVNKSYTLLKDDGYIRMDRRKGAVISFSLEDSKKKFENKMIKEMEIMVAECINRGVPCDDIKNGIDSLYKEFLSGKEGGL